MNHCRKRAYSLWEGLKLISLVQLCTTQPLHMAVVRALYVLSQAGTLFVTAVRHHGVLCLKLWLIFKESASCPSAVLCLLHTSQNVQHTPPHFAQINTIKMAISEAGRVTRNQTNIAPPPASTGLNVIYCGPPNWHSQVNKSVAITFWPVNVFQVRVE